MQIIEYLDRFNFHLVGEQLFTPPSQPFPKHYDENLWRGIADGPLSHAQVKAIISYRGGVVSDELDLSRYTVIIIGQPPYKAQDSFFESLPQLTTHVTGEFQNNDWLFKVLTRQIAVGLTQSNGMRFFPADVMTEAAIYNTCPFRF